ncbi:hypothetical protein [Oenococcus sicerae]|uniref:Uncharacterized protein n=1 Tax=Oenococcus sicerae TaxID=2203724 RepID=A0AAJ1RB51_9LACO|nr:hypothetical protein [Oenococcus sicerae]MDN6899562.1 hypothetical protein [Oenococcus sicerae]
MIYADRYGKDHGNIKGMLVLYDTENYCYVQSAFKCHIKRTPSINQAKHFFHLDEVDFFMELHNMAAWKYELRADNT